MNQKDHKIRHAGRCTGPLSRCLVILVICTQSLSGQPFQSHSGVAGSWISTVDWFRFTFRINETEDGSFATHFDVPAQESWDIPVDMETTGDSAISFDIYNIRCRYEGVLNEGGDTILGSFIGPDGDTMTINLAKTNNPPVRTSKRPQEPEKPYPYRSENVIFANSIDDIQLQGTLTLPDTQGPHRAVILISGSGPNDRDQLIWGHRTFLVLSDYLTRQGIAVLRYDDRGVGRSEGNHDEARFDQFSCDALAACSYLRSRPEIDHDQIGLLGHSEGAAIAPIAASMSEGISFMILLSAPGYNAITSEQLGLVSQFELNYRNNGASEEAISFKCNMLSRMFKIAREEDDRSLARKKIRELLDDNRTALMALNETDRKIIEMESPESYDIEWILSTGFLNILRYDPEVFLSEVECPVLALHGTKDFQVPVENLEGVEQALIKGGNPDYTVIRIEGLNHLFQTAVTGDPSEYPKIEETIAPEALALISEWILR